MLISTYIFENGFEPPWKQLARVKASTSWFANGSQQLGIVDDDDRNSVDSSDYSSEVSVLSAILEQSLRTSDRERSSDDVSRNITMDEFRIHYEGAIGRRHETINGVGTPRSEDHSACPKREPVISADGRRNIPKELYHMATPVSLIPKSYKN